MKSGNKLKSVRIALIVAVIALLAFGAYVLYDSRQSKDNSPSQKPVASTPEGSNEPDETDQPKSEPATKKYTDEKLEGMTFEYPSSWKAEPRPTNDDTNIHNVYLDAPNTKFGDTKFPSIISGARFSVTKSNPSKIGAPATMAAFKKSPYFSQLSKNSKDIMVDGQPAVARDTLYEGPLTYTVTIFIGGRQYDIMTQKKIYEDTRYKKVFDDIVASIKFN